MKVTIARDDLVAGLSYVMGAVEKRSAIPILTCVRLTAAALLDVSATDNELAARASIATARIDRKGDIAVNADMLLAFARKLPASAEVTITAEPDGQFNHGAVTVTAGRSRLALPSFPAADMPVMDAPGGATFALPAPSLRRLIDKTLIAVSTEATRYYLGGVFLHLAGPPGERRLAAAATDGYRLAFASTEAPDGLDDLSAIIPTAALREIRKMVDDGNGDVTLDISATRALVSYKGCEIIAKLIDGTFPEYQRIVPQDLPSRFECDRAALAAAIERTLVVMKDEARTVRFDVADDEMKITARSPDTGEAQDGVDGCFTGKPVEIGFNGKFMMAALGVLGGENAILSMGGATAPAKLSQEGDPFAFSVLMPLRV